MISPVSVFIVASIFMVANGLAIQADSKDVKGPEKKVMATCPQGYVSVQDYCYRMQLVYGNFELQRSYCFDNGGYLATISTAEESAVFTSYLQSLNLGTSNWALWIGLKDFAGDNTDFRWLFENMAVDFTNWMVDNPSHSDWRCAVAIAYPKYGGAIGQWDDIHCDYQLGAVCEAEPVTVVQEHQPVATFERAQTTTVVEETTTGVNVLEEKESKLQSVATFERAQTTTVVEETTTGVNILEEKERRH